MSRWAQIFAIVPLLLIVGVPFLMRPAEQVTAQSDPKARLVILTPHSEQIRYEFARAFNAHRIAQGNAPIEFDWRTPGGTSDLMRIIKSSFAEAAKNGVADGGIGYDLIFGGGDFNFNDLARGISVGDESNPTHVPLLAPLDMSAEELRTMFGSDTIAGSPLYRADAQGKVQWVGAVLSSFGIVYNRDRLTMLGLQEPTTWADLAQPAYRNELALADPSHSGSIAAAYMVVLQRHGWDEGWRILRRMGANARYFSSSASKVPVDVSAAEAAAGLCIEFYGRFQAGAVPEQRVGYVDPPKMTSITADPIAILRGAEHMDLAQEFVRWLLKPEAQGLWQRRVGTPGGPEKFELRRMPIRADVYQPAEVARWADDVKPYVIAEPVPEGTANFYAWVAPVTQVASIDVHGDLKAAWAALLTHADHRHHVQMLALFDAMPPELSLAPEDDPAVKPYLAAYRNADDPQHDEARRALERLLVARLKSRYENSADPDLRYKDRARWVRFFQDNYRQIVRLSQE